MILAANLSMLFNEYDFLERFDQAAKAGFTAVEYLFPYDFDQQEIKDRLDANGLTQGLFNAPPGDWETGDRGIASIVGRESEFKEGIEKAKEYALVLGNKRVHVMAGLVSEDTDMKIARECYVNNLRYAADVFALHGLQVLVEPINNLDMPGYFLNYQEDASDLIEAIGKDNVRLQFDVYHCQMMQGNVVATFKKLFKFIDHVQVAGVPNRHEIHQCEINYAYIFSAMKKIGYQGYVGCEYMPSAQTVDGMPQLFELWRSVCS